MLFVFLLFILIAFFIKLASCIMEAKETQKKFYLERKSFTLNEKAENSNEYFC